MNLRSCRVDQASKLDSSGGVSAGLGLAFGDFGADRWKKDSELARSAFAAAAVAASRAGVGIFARKLGNFRDLI
jgi:hypothetical protein